MEEIKDYVNKLFKQLPHNQRYKKLKEDILIDSKNKYDEYIKQYGEGASKKIIKEIGTFQDLYQGGFYYEEWFNIITIILLILFLVFLSLIKADAMELAEASLSFDVSIYNISAYFILQFPKYFSWIIIFYIISNLVQYHISIVFKNKIIEYLILVILIVSWIVIVLLLFQFITADFSLLPRNFYVEYVVKHKNYFVLFEIILGLMTGFSTGYFVLKRRNKNINKKMWKEILDEVPSLTRSSEQGIKKTVVTYFVDSAKVQRAGTGSNEYNEDILDHSFNVYSTFYYTKSYDDGVTYVLLTKAEGGITRKDNAWTIYSQTVTIGCNGTSVGPVVHNQKKSYSIGASASYSYNAPSSWLPVSINDDFYYIGILYEWEIGRINGAGYTGEVQNYY